MKVSDSGEYNDVMVHGYRIAGNFRMVEIFIYFVL